VPDIFDELEEDLRAERTKRFLTRYGIAVVAVVLVFAGGVGAFKAWEGWEARSSAGVGDRFLDAMRIADGPAAGRSAAIPDFEAVAQASAAGYRTLARLRAAALQADAGNLAAASILWDQVGTDGAADPVLRDFANLQWALHHVDSAPDAAAVADRLKALSGPNGAWRPLAQEAQAVLDLRQGNKDAARDMLKSLTQDTTVPDGVRGRANGLLAGLGS
jgi:hypothetical protein